MLSRVNEVNGENLHDPPNQKSWLRQWGLAAWIKMDDDDDDDDYMDVSIIT